MTLRELVREEHEDKYCAELSIPSVVLKGLAEQALAALPRRHYEDKQAEAKDGH